MVLQGCFLVKFVGGVGGAAIGAVGGALGGAVEGLQKGQGHPSYVVGGAFGGAVDGLITGAKEGANMADEFLKIKTKSAQEVREEYKDSHEGDLPRKPVILEYKAAFSTPQNIRAGEASELVISFKIDTPEGIKPLVESEIVIYWPDGEELDKMRFSYDVDAGGYVFKHQIPCPQNASQGLYLLKTFLYLDGEEAGRSVVYLQVTSTINSWPLYAATSLPSGCFLKPHGLSLAS